VTSILEAADRILRTDGYEAASTNRVARVAGFSVGSLYQYFRDKQAIVGALIDREMAAEADALRDLLERSAGRPLRELAASAFAEMLSRRAARAHLYRALDAHAGELGAPCVLDHFVAAQAPALSDTVQRVAAQLLPRSARSIDARTYVLSRVALSASFALAVDAPTGVTASELTEAFGEATHRYLDGKPPGSAAATLVLAWAKPAASSNGALAEQRGRRRREARGVLLAGGVDGARLEPLVVLVASLADVAQATPRPLYGATHEDLLHEVARFAEALGV
jgi:AcrR family transcriptional regulator